MTVVAKFVYLQLSNHRDVLPVEWPLCRLWSKRVSACAAAFRFLLFRTACSECLVKLGHLPGLFFSTFVLAMTVEPLFMLGLALFVVSIAGPEDQLLSKHRLILATYVRLHLTPSLTRLSALTILENP